MHLQTIAVRRARQKRKWAPTPEGVGELSRSARQLAKSSAIRIARLEVAECLARLKTVMTMERVCRIVMGDLLIELIDGHGLRAIDIARETGYRPSDLSEMRKTARTFPPNRRPAGVHYSQLLMATQMLGKFPELGFSPLQALKEIRGTGFSQHRDITRHFSTLARALVVEPMRLMPDLRDIHPHNRAYHSRFQDLLGVFPDQSISLIHIDPPYVYSRGMYSSRSASSLACDGDDPAAAIASVVDLLRDWKCKLKPNGVALLWQPWGPLRPEIAQAIQTYEWELWGPIVWDKMRPQPGDFSSAYTVQGEMLWMLHRPGDTPINCDGSPRSSILRYPSVSRPGKAGEQMHAFEKPLALCKFLVGKHTFRRELIADFCGCTGSMSVAAIQMNRRFVYAESNTSNYEIGSRRIAENLSGFKAKAS